MNRTFLLKATSVATLSVAALVASTTVAQAQNILNVNGQVNVRDQTPGGGGDVLLLDFLTNGVAGFGTAGTVIAVPDTDLPGVSTSTASPTVGQMRDLSVTAGGVVGTPVANFLTIGGYTFTLTSAPAGNTFGPISLLQVGANTIAAFSAMGTVTGGSFGSTVRTFDLSVSSQFNNVTPTQLFDIINSGGTRNSAFSATFTIAPATVIPEPSTYALLATGVAALGAFARRRQAKA